ncbi:hypothetical protein MMMB2_3782 [Mycobacterium marinum MB2]|nr:hypothetical protein MMMB2_3782 [Mycobacterium marinum MB2]
MVPDPLGLLIGQKVRKRLHEMNFPDRLGGVVWQWLTGAFRCDRSVASAVAG